MGADASPRIRWELGKLADVDALELGEITCDAEEVMRKGRPHVLLLTDRRLLLTRTGVIRRRTRVDAVPLTDIEAVDASTDPVWEDRWGALTLSVQGSDPVYLEAIPGGSARAEELARAIRRQQELVSH